MKLGEFVKNALEQKYLNKRIKSWDGSTTFIVSHVSVDDGGVDPQWEILLSSNLHQQMNKESFDWQKINNPIGGVLAPKELSERWRSGFMEYYTLNFCDNDVPEIVNNEESLDEEENEDLSSCEQCGENAWDGYICHSCGMKEI